MKICPKCGTQLPDDMGFCGRCGVKLPENAPTKSTPPAEIKPVPKPSAKPMSKKLITTIIAIVIIAVVVTASVSYVVMRQDEKDTTPPVISNFQVSSITSSSATITWTTDEPATSGVIHFPDGSGPIYDTLVTSHSITLTHLTPSTTYYCVIKSEDASNNRATLLHITFTTATAVTT